MARVVVPTGLPVGATAAAGGAPWGARVAVPAWGTAEANHTAEANRTPGANLGGTRRGKGGSTMPGTTGVSVGKVVSTAAWAHKPGRGHP